MKPGHKLQLRVSVFTLILGFSFVSCQTVQQCFNTRPLPVQKKVSKVEYSALSAGRFLYFSLFVVNILVMVVINPLSPSIHIQILQTDLYIFP